MTRASRRWLLITAISSVILIALLESANELYR